MVKTKLKEEILVKNYYENYGVKATTLRLGSICGISPGMRFHAAISKFCFQASTDQSISVWKTALNQKRPYLNIARGILRKQGYTFISTDIDIKINDVVKRTTKYIIFRNN